MGGLRIYPLKKVSRTTAHREVSQGKKLEDAEQISIKSVKGSSLIMTSSTAVNNSKSWVGRTFGKSNLPVRGSVSNVTSYQRRKKDDDGDITASSYSDFSSASILMSNTMGTLSATSTSSVGSNNTNMSTMRTFTSRPSIGVSLQSHRTRISSGGQDFAFMTKNQNFSTALRLPISEALVTLSDILSVSLFALVRWWKHRQQLHLLQPPALQLDSLSYSILQEPFSLQLIPRTTQLNSSAQKSRQSDPVAHGLRNHGQTCFLNSIIQALASLPPIIAYLETIALEQHLRFPKMSIVNNHDGHSSQLHSSTHKTKEPTLTEVLLGILSSVGATSPRFHIKTSTHIDTRDILHKVGSKHAQFNSDGNQDRSCLMQQDAQEFLQALMDMIVSEAEEVMEKSKSSMNINTSNSVLSGTTKSHVRSSVLKYDQLSSNYEHDAPVSLDGLLDFIIDHEQKKHQKEAENVLSRIKISSHKEEKKQDECDHDEIPEHQRDRDDKLQTSNFPLNSEDKMSQTPHSTDTPASMKMLHSLSSTTPCPLSGWVGSLLQCSSCLHVRPIQNAPFLDIPLVPTTLMNDNRYRHSSDQHGRPVCTLEQCLSAFSKVERVQNVECCNCARLNKMKELEEEINLLKGGIQSRLSEQKRKKLQLESNHKNSSNEQDDFDVDGLESQLIECQQRYEYLMTKDPDDVENDQNPNTDDGSMFDDDLQSLSNILSEDSSLSSPPPRGAANKCLLLTRLPSILCLHVQRRFYDARSGHMLKSSSHIDFPEILDVSSHCAYGGGGQRQSASPSKKTKTDKIEYRLMSAVEHRGNANSGHYQTYRRVGNNSETERWAMISDESVKYVEWNVVKKCQAYMLFYEAI